MIDVVAVHAPMPLLHQLAANILGAGLLAFAAKWCVMALWPRRTSDSGDDDA